MAELSVKIGADIQDLIKKLNLTEKQFNELAIEAAKTGKTLDQVLKKSGKGGAELKRGLDVGTKGMQDLGKSTANAVPTLTSFSQVIQDAPYGIRGVANNITQLTSQFGYLAKSTGGAGGALKALGSSLLGPAGILFAVSAITSALVTYEDEIYALFDTTAKAALKQKELREELESTKEVLDSRITALDAEIDLLEAQGKSTKILKAEKLKILETAVENLSLQKQSLQTELATAKAELARISIIDKIRLGLAGITGIAFTPISDDDIKALNELETNINEIDAAISNANKSILKIKQPNLFDGSAKKEKEALNKLAEELKPIIESLDLSIDLTGKTSEQLNVLKRQLVDYKKTIEFTNEDLVKLDEEKEQEKLDNALFFANKVAEQTGAIANKSATDQKEFFVTEIEDGYNQIIAKQKDFEDALRNTQGIISRIGLDPAKFDLSGLDTSALDELAFKLQGTQQVAQVFGSAVSNSIGQMVGRLSEYISTGNELIDGFVGSILNSLANMLAQLITQQVAQAAAQTAIQASTAAAQGAAAITTATASGLAAKAQGVLIATSAATAAGPLGIGLLGPFLTQVQAQIAGALALAAVPSFAFGGYSGDDNLAFLNKNELVLNPNQQATLFSLLKGNIGSISSSTVNPTPETIVGEVILRGNTQVVQLRRSEKRMSRFYNS